VLASGPEVDADTADSMDRRSQARQRIRRIAMKWVRVILVAALVLPISTSAASGVLP
jgi:hypothetical protein